MASSIDPNFITAAPVEKAGMILQLQRAKDEITDLQNGKVAATGGTMTGDLAIEKATPTLAMRKLASGQANIIAGYHNATLRWTVSLGDTTAESAGNAGSDFTLNRYNDGGGIIDNVLHITRSTGVLAFGKTPTAPTASLGDNSTRLATTAFMRNAFTGTNQSLVTNGFQKLPGGFIMQWGLAVTVNGVIVVNYPIGFPTACLNVTASVQAAVAGDYPAIGINVLNNVGFGAFSPIGTNLGFFWQAFGV